MNRDEAVKKIAKAGGLSLFYAEDLYDSIIPKPTVPQYVADWYEENKDYFENKLFVYIRNFNIYNSWNESKNFKLWFDDNEDSIQKLVNMHQFGYEVSERNNESKIAELKTELKQAKAKIKLLKENQVIVYYADSYGGNP